MKKTGFILKLMLCSFIPFIAGCGTEDIGGGAVYFDTVMVYAEPEEEVIDSSIEELTADSIDVTITSEAISDDIDAQRVRVKSVKIDYNPHSGSPALDSVSYSLGQTIPPAESITLAIRVVSVEQKTSPPLKDLVPGKTYNYSLNLTFTGVEIKTNTTKQFSVDPHLVVTDEKEDKDGEDGDDGDDGDTGDGADGDGDGVLDSDDNCPNDSNSDQADSDGDDIGDVCDNCPDDSNSDQADSDDDGIGDVCDTV